jgi:glycosyltransferase involved in cell wall biosynthesis
MKRHHPSRDAVVLIPALDEAATIASVIAVARAAAVGPVVVIDDGSTDGTAEVAAEAGAEVLRLATNHGKGGALHAGASSRREAVVVLLDADLTGLRPKHVRALVQPVATGRVDMTRGVFVGGRWATALAQRMLPILNGQRALLREGLLSVPGLADSRYGVEIAIAEHAKSEGWNTLDVPLPGVSQVVKEEKRGVVRGVLVRLRMYAEILWAFLRAPSYARTRARDARARAGDARAQAGDARGALRHPPAPAHARGTVPQRAPAAQRKAPRR